MEPLHELAARIGLAAIGRYRLRCPGAWVSPAAVGDVDLFTVADAQDYFDDAVTAAAEAYQAGGLAVEVVRRGATFARLLLTAGDSRQVRACSPGVVPHGGEWKGRHAVS